MVSSRHILRYTPALVLGLTLVVGCPVLLGFCWTHRVWSVGSWRVYQAMGRECHPVWRDYHSGRILAGDPVEDVIERTAPGRVERKGRWVILHYTEGTEAGGWCFRRRAVAAGLACSSTR